MTLNTSFGSMFNPERISRRNFENLSNPEHNIENLKNDAERPKDFPAFPNESIGRSQVAKTNYKLPHKLELSQEDKEFLSKLTSVKYGFHGNSNDFWFHSYKPTPDNIPNLSMGDGKLENNKTREDFVKELVDNETQAYQIAGIDKLGGNKLITVVQNNKTNTTTMYTCDSKQCYPLVFDGNIENKKLAESIVDMLNTVQGVTIWKN